MGIDLKPEVATGLAALAAAHGLSVEDYLQALVRRELPPVVSDVPSVGSESGMVEENGLRVYRTGNPLLPHLVEDAIRRSREERSLHILGNLS